MLEESKNTRTQTLTKRGTELTDSYMITVRFSNTLRYTAAGVTEACSAFGSEMGHTHNSILRTAGQQTLEFCPLVFIPPSSGVSTQFFFKTFLTPIGENLVRELGMVPCSYLAKG